MSLSARLRYAGQKVNITYSSVRQSVITLWHECYPLQHPCLVLYIVKAADIVTWDWTWRPGHSSLSGCCATCRWPHGNRFHQSAPVLTHLHWHTSDNELRHSCVILVAPSKKLGWDSEKSCVKTEEREPDLQAVICFISQSMASMNWSGKRINPCLTPIVMYKLVVDANSVNSVCITFSKSRTWRVVYIVWSVLWYILLHDHPFRCNPDLLCLHWRAFWHMTKSGLSFHFISFFLIIMVKSSYRKGLWYGSK